MMHFDLFYFRRNVRKMMRYNVSRNYRIFREFQQQLFDTSIFELYGSFGVLASAFYLDDGTHTKALMLNDITLF